MKRKSNDIEYYNSETPKQKFPLWLLLVIILLLCLGAYVIYNSTTSKSNVNNTIKTSNFTYKF